MTEAATFVAEAISIFLGELLAREALEADNARVRQQLADEQAAREEITELYGNAVEAYADACRHARAARDQLQELVDEVEGVADAIAHLDTILDD